MRCARRDFIHAGLAVTGCQASGRKSAIAFVPGSIGIQADQRRAIELAAKHGFESVEPFGPQLLKEGSVRYIDALDRAGLPSRCSGYAQTACNVVAGRKPPFLRGTG